MAKRLDELVVWQLSNELRFRVHALAKGAGVRDDYLSRFLLIARGSLFELQDHLSDGISREYWREGDLDDLRRLCRRTTGALNGLIRYLGTARAADVLEQWERSAPVGKLKRKRG